MPINWNELFCKGDAVNTDCPAHLPKDDNLRQFGSSCYEFVLGDPQSWHTVFLRRTDYTSPGCVREKLVAVLKYRPVLAFYFDMS